MSTISIYLIPPPFIIDVLPLNSLFWSPPTAVHDLTHQIWRFLVYIFLGPAYPCYPSKKTYSAFLFSSSRGGLLLFTENGESYSFPPLVESTKNGILEELLLRRAPLLLLKWSTPFFHQKRMVLLISSSCGESSSFPPFEENSPKEELRRNSF